MNHIEGIFKSVDGLDLFFQAWLPDESFEAILVVVHGYDDHSGRYEHLVGHFLPKGYALYAFDQRGHGRSQGQRGHVKSFKDYLSDVKLFINNVRAKNPDSRLFLVGHSMGGLIALTYSHRYTKDMSGVIVSSPFLGLSSKLPSWQMVLVKLLSYIWPSLKLPNRTIKPELISHDRAIIEAKEKDTLNHHVTTPRWFTEVTRAQETLLGAGQISLPPLLVLFAQDDRIVDPKLAPMFFQNIPGNDKEIHGYKGYYHELFNEVGRGTVFEDMEGWLSKRI
jgi:alpha-beta hydrolase superfamily lysophospholipase